MKTNPKYNPQRNRLSQVFKNSDEDSSTSSKFKHDREAWHALKRGDDAAFSYIYYKYIDYLFNYGCHIISDRELVKDAIQDLFIELNRWRKRLGDVESVKAYLYVSLRREILRKLKREKKHAHCPLRSNLEGFQMEISPERNLINSQLTKERAKRLENIINNLSQRQRQAVLYYYYEGFSYKEIARLLELKTAKSARKLVYRAIASMRNKLGFRKSLSEKILFLLMLLFFI